MQALKKIKGLTYSLISRVGIFCLPLWVLEILLGENCLRALLKLSGCNLKLLIPARVGVMTSVLKQFQRRRIPCSCLIIGGWTLEGYPKFIASFLPANSKLVCIDTYNNLLNQDYEFTHQEKNNHRYAAIALQLALKNKRNIERNSILDVRVVCANNLNKIDELYDIIFIDANYQYDAYKIMLQNSYLSLNDGGVIIGDDFELQLPIPNLLIEECKRSVNKDLIYSEVVTEYVHPGIVLGLHNFISMNPEIRVEASSGIYVVRKNDKWATIHES